MAETKSTCCYCGVGCGVIIEHSANKITGVRGDPTHPANFGRLCSKGAALHLTVVREGRALEPELRTRRDLARENVSWETAIDHAAEKFAQLIREHGPDAVAFYVSGQLLTEDYYVFNKLAKGLIGTNNIDSNSRLCMSSAVSGYKMTLGADSPPCSYEDIDHTDCLLISGSNTAFAHPVLFRRIEDAKAKNPDLKIIVIDPRRTDTAAFADLHLAILPGTDLVLHSALLHVLLWEGLTNNAYIQAYTDGFAALRDAVREITPAFAAQVCGVKADDIIQAARWFGNAKAALSMWCQGLNQSVHGSHNSASLVHLHLATGQIGRAGAGPFSLTGQPNAMGGREVGAMAGLMSGHRDMANATHRAEVAALWNVASVPVTPGKTAVEMFEAIRTGEIKAVWICCTNPAQSLPHQKLVREALEKAEFVVLQEAFRTTETAPYADLILPAATWGEKEGVVTNSERRITRLHRAVTPAGNAKPDWQIACDFAKALRLKMASNGAANNANLAYFDYQKAEDIFNEHASTTQGRDLDIAALTYTILAEQGAQQWPYNTVSGGAKRLFADGKFATANGRAQFVPIVLNTVAEATSAPYPLHLTTGRLRDQWHGMSRTGKAAQLFNHYDEATLGMHADDMQRRKFVDGDLVEVKSRRGKIIVRVQTDAQMRLGQTFLPMHFGRAHLSHSGANELMPANFDPFSKQPELKHAAIQVSGVSLPYQVMAMRLGGTAGESLHELALQRMAALQPLLQQFDYASIALAGRDDPAVVLRIGSKTPISAAQTQAIDTALHLDDDNCLSFKDGRRHIDKKALLQDGRLLGIRFCGEIAAGKWLRDIALEGVDTANLRRWVFAPVATPPANIGSTKGKTICSCNGVGEAAIINGVAAGMDLAGLQKNLNCGTGCGSCVPEIKRIIHLQRSAQYAA